MLTAPLQRLQLAVSILFDEIRASAQAAAVSIGDARQQAYPRGYDAIARLFPEKTPGDIRLFFSKIQTLEGGNIDLLVPDGAVNVGLASGFTAGKNNTADLGIVAQRQGNINILVNGDLQVNQQRVFTLDSGDITVWSSEGNIDAGRGAKSALTAPSPKVSVDRATGKIIVEFPPTVSGSGIRAQSGFNNDHIGDVILAAPRGVVNAGEAGIGGNNIVIAANAVIGASNIQAVSSSIGITQGTLTAVVPASAGNASAAAAAKTAESTDTENDSDEDKDQKRRKSTKVAILETQLLGFGKCSVDDVRKGSPGCSE